MSTKWEKLEGNVGVLTIEVDAKEVNNSIDAAFKKVVKQLTYQVSVKEKCLVHYSNNALVLNLYTKML